MPRVGWKRWQCPLLTSIRARSHLPSFLKAACLPLDTMSAGEGASFPAQSSPSLCLDKKRFLLHQFAENPRLQNHQLQRPPERAELTRLCEKYSHSDCDLPSPTDEDTDSQRDHQLTHGHTARKYQSQDLNLGLTSPPEFIVTDRKALGYKGRVCELLLHTIPKGKLPIIWQGLHQEAQGPQVFDSDENGLFTSKARTPL